MIRKFVNCDINLVQFFYPEFEIKHYVNFLDRENKIIYIGKPLSNLREYLENNTKELARNSLESRIHGASNIYISTQKERTDLITV